MNGHCNHVALKFSVCVKASQGRLPTMYWLPKLHKGPYKARFIANSSSCTTTELSELLTSCLTAVTNHIIKYCEKLSGLSKGKVHLILPVTTDRLSSLLETQNDINFGLVKTCVKP